MVKIQKKKGKVIIYLTSYLFSFLSFIFFSVIFFSHYSDLITFVKVNYIFIFWLIISVIAFFIKIELISIDKVENKVKFNNTIINNSEIKLFQIFKDNSFIYFFSRRPDLGLVLILNNGEIYFIKTFAYLKSTSFKVLKILENEGFNVDYKIVLKSEVGNLNSLKNEDEKNLDDENTQKIFHDESLSNLEINNEVEKILKQEDENLK